MKSNLHLNKAAPRIEKAKKLKSCRAAFDLSTIDQSVSQHAMLVWLYKRLHDGKLIQVIASATIEVLAHCCAKQAGMAQTHLGYTHLVLVSKHGTKMNFYCCCACIVPVDTRP